MIVGCARALPAALEPPECACMGTQMFHAGARGRSNKRLNATALKRLSHVRRAGRRVIRSVRLLRVMRTHKFWVPFVCSLVVTPIVLFVGAASTGAGHGSYLLVKVLFPYTMLSAAVFDVIYFPFAFLALFQFPAYGLVLGYANEKGKVARMAVILLAAHSVVASVALLLSSESFP